MGPFAQVFVCPEVGVAVVFDHPIAQGATVKVVKWLSQVTHPAVHDDVLIHRTFLDASHASLEEPQKPSRIEPAVP